MRDPIARNLGLAAAVLLVAGLAFGVLPFSARAAPCGSVFVASSDPFEADLERTSWDASDIAAAADVGSHQDACADARGPRRIATIALLVGGAGLAVATVARRRDTSAPGRHVAAR